MDCKEVRESLVAFVDRELAPEVMRAVEAHIKGCPDCEAEHRKLAKFTTSIVELLEPLRPSRSFKEAVLTTVTTHERRGIGFGPPPSDDGWWRRLRGHWPLLLVAAASVAALGATAALILRPSVPVGMLLVERGSAKVLAYGRGRWRAVGDRAEIFAGERVETSPGSLARVRLEGASVTLGESTTVQIESTAEALRIHFASPGEVYAEMNTLREFQVVAQKVRMTLSRGAASVRLGQSGEIRVSACEGDLRIDNPADGIEIRLAEGKETLVPQSGPPRREPVEIPSDRLDWLKQAQPPAPPAPPEGP